MFSAPKLKAIVLLTFGSGNAPSDEKFIKFIKKEIESGKTIINLTQCNGGSVQQGKYETSNQLLKLGVIGAEDMTIEAVITKLMVVLAEHENTKKIKKEFLKNVSGEIS